MQTGRGNAQGTRGLFIVLEGIDRAGKSTQVKHVVQHLESRGWPALPMAFPDRCTGVGVLIDAYLKGRKTVSPECLHLLFSANRWEQEHVLESFIKSGTSIVCDRFAYSGAAYSHGAEGLDFEWCLCADRGLLRPDIVYQLGVDPKECMVRAGFGSEVYERLDKARNIARAYERFHEMDNWVYIPGSPPNYTSGDDETGSDSADESTWSRSQGSIQYVTEQIKRHLDQFLDSIPQINGRTTLALRQLGDAYPW